ncbi:protein phosphatase 2C domain-containing protein [Mycolicibacterium llatzerense]|uniref:protein phosphatase 2C domain-containing protein n=1 Tax=Mycolicibacterium llatzerense TaxID=280871 RepID=UPI0008DCF508|nr:protein phosphatase 2C domain-containing protein [Mycolicibacterium llatzerense]
MLEEGLLLSFNNPKREGQGEDADPVACDSGDAEWIGVFDGMGGAGASSYETDDGKRSGAYLASRTVAGLCEKWARTEAGALTGGERKRSLHDVLSVGLADQLLALSPSKSRIRGRLLKSLPTTLAVVGVHNRSDHYVDCDVMWAGDSRIYCLEPGRGLVQLSTDHLEQSLDAQANLLGDDALSNFLSADNPFFIEELWAQLPKPVLLIAATDGCFGYVYSPAHFELLLLASLGDSTDPDHWAANLQSRIGEVTGDDASMAILQYGWDSFEALRNAFEPRWQIVAPLIGQLDLARQQAKDAAAALTKADDELAAMTSRYWQTYRASYESGIQTSRWPS